MKTIIERGASWTLEETKILLHLWGQDLVQRSATNTKRTKEVYEKISERFNQAGFERTADQVRTRIFNMIAEYRRILKDPNNPGRREKCIFFEALHRIYKAKHMDDIKSALDDYEPEYLYSPLSNTVPSEKGDDSVSDSEATDGNETINQSATNSNSNATSNNNLPSCGNNQNLTTAKNNNNNGDSNNNSNNDEKESAAVSNANSASASSGSKRIKLESPKSSEKAPSASLAASSSSSSSSSTTQATASTSTEKEHSKQAKTQHHQQVPSVGTSGTATIGATNASTSSSSSSSNSQRHQSLLLPHATTSSASSSATPTSIGKLAANSGNNTPSYININSAKLPIIRTNQLIGHSNGNESVNLNGTTTRLPTTAAITSHQLYQAPVNTFDVTSSALLIDRTFAHLSRENENMREWIALEKERLAIERVRRQQETEREVRRERVLIDTLMRFQEQWLAFLSRIDPKLLQNPDDPPPELKIPTKDNNGNLMAPGGDTTSSQPTSVTQTKTTTTSNTSSLSTSQSSSGSPSISTPVDGGKV